ncbi:MAG: glycoside hydrolase family 2 TIM barrel-domain containing protein, partial [Bacteroidota bacterium]
PSVLPLIHWEVPLHWLQDSIQLTPILEGQYDTYLRALQSSIASMEGPLVLYFAPIPSNQLSQIDSSAYQQLWHYVYQSFREAALDQVVWMWSSNDSALVRRYYPQVDRIDLVGMSFEGDSELMAFQQQYEAFRELFAPSPIFVFDRSHAQREAAAFYSNLSGLIGQEYPELQAWIFEQEKLASPYRHFAKSIHRRSFYEAPPRFIPPQPNKAHSAKPKDIIAVSDQEQSPQVFIQSEGGKYQLIQNGLPLYLKGITYNPGHDWRDAHTPLSVAVLERDFSRIKEMGANMIRRYKPSTYDYNLLKTAHEYDLLVLYGFYFDPKVDYYLDTAKVAQYKQEVIQSVLRHKDHPAILAWGLGNESWGLLKHYFRPTYLPRVRRAYLHMIEEIAQEIQQIDPHHPIFSTMEHSDDLNAALRSFEHYAPSLDFLGINTYYEERISKLDSIVQATIGNIPYLVSEFGPKGYWEPRYNSLDERGQLLEQSAYQKAADYRHHWQDNILPYQGHNLGGVAFCWRDRFEGSATWFGITDIKDRKKPAYYVLKEMWTGQKKPFPIADAYLIPPWETSQFRFSKVYSLGQSEADLHYEWYICEENDFRRIGNTSVKDGGQSALLQLPAKDQAYRVYVHISDDQGNVVTCSTPFQSNSGR